VTSQPDRLLSSWLQLVAERDGSREVAQTLYADLVQRYAEPTRHYHTLDHIAAMLDTLTLLPAPAAAPAVRLAVWFHDAIYDSRAGDNEERSAAHARSQLQPLGWPAEFLDETARLILLTKTHLAGSGDTAGQVLLDADLAILGASAEDYDRYARAIRKEYAWVEEVRYREGRGKVLRGFLDRPRLYVTPILFDRSERQARHNLQRELETLA
jgi:predicted metal-dependent HD superfamily phosphohydrolase